MKKLFNIPAIKSVTGGVGFGFILIAFLCFVTVLCALFEGGVMSLFGFEYQSISSYFIFFVAVFIVGIPVDLFSQALPRVLFITKSLDRLYSWRYFAIMIGCETLGYSLIMIIVDAIMGSITASGFAILAGTFAMALIDAWLDYRMPDNWSTDEIMDEFSDFL